MGTSAGSTSTTTTGTAAARAGSCFCPSAAQPEVEIRTARPASPQRIGMSLMLCMLVACRSSLVGTDARCSLLVARCSLARRSTSACLRARFGAGVRAGARTRDRRPPDQRATGNGQRALSSLTAPAQGRENDGRGRLIPGFRADQEIVKVAVRPVLTEVHAHVPGAFGVHASNELGHVGSLLHSPACPRQLAFPWRVNEDVKRLGARLQDALGAAADHHAVPGLIGVLYEGTRQVGHGLGIEDLGGGQPGDAFEGSEPQSVAAQTVHPGVDAFVETPRQRRIDVRRLGDLVDQRAVKQIPAQPPGRQTGDAGAAAAVLPCHCQDSVHTARPFQIMSSRNSTSLATLSRDQPNSRCRISPRIISEMVKAAAPARTARIWPLAAALSSTASSILTCSRWRLRHSLLTCAAPKLPNSEW